MGSVSNRPRTPLAKAWEIARQSPDPHPVMVATQVVRDGGSDDAFIVALLHDALEDGYASEDEIVAEFSVTIYSAVYTLTRQPGEEYADYIDRINESGDHLAQFVKKADLTVNLHRSAEDGRASLVKRYVRALEVLV